MIELVQLERRHEDFAKRNTRIVAVSVEGVEDAKKTQTEKPHLTVLADHGHGLTDAVGVLHKQAAPDGSDIDMPTTFLIDRQGVVRWVFRPDAVYTRLSPDDLLRVIDEKLPAR
jgi:alkyl hydroperoxide reductase subunit AhpC